MSLWIRRCVAPVLLIGAVATAVTSQDAPTGFSLTPAVSVPLGDDAQYFDAGATADLTLFARPDGLPRLVPALRVGYAFHGLDYGAHLSLVAGGIAAGVVVVQHERTEVELLAGGGYYHGFLDDTDPVSSGGGFAFAETSASLQLGPVFSVSVHAGYRRLFGLMHALSAGIGGRLRIDKPVVEADAQPFVAPPRPLAAARDAAPLALVAPYFDDLFPVFFKYYDEHPIGGATLRNASQERIEDLAITFTAGRYTDGAIPCRTPVALEPGEAGEVDIMALFNEAVLDITEATKVGAELRVSFLHDGRRYEQTYTETIRLHDRNSMTWDDDRKPAAYVTPRDPAVMSIAKLTSSVIASEPASPVSESMRRAMALHAALELYGLSYTPDPRSPLRTGGSRSLAVDYLQFPRQTLDYRGGDCDDLSILYVALLESMGVRTAFVLVPGHVFVAFDSGLNPQEARRSLPRWEDLIADDETVWIPVEATALGDGFLAAWRAGARQWREGQASHAALLLETRESWDVYEPVGLPGHGETIALPAANRIVTPYREELRRLVEQSILGLVDELQGRIRTSPDPVPLQNRLASLYGRYGLYDRAREVLEEILAARNDYGPAIITMGNVLLAGGEAAEAMRYFERALELDPENPRILLALAQLHHSLEEYEVATAMVVRAREIAPALAAPFAFIDLTGTDGSRAASRPEITDLILWEEDEE